MSVGFSRAKQYLIPFIVLALLCGCRYEYPTKVAAKKTRKALGATETKEAEVESSSVSVEPSLASDLEQPVRLEADGKPIDIATLSDYGHAGPWVADVDCDGDRDLLVGDFPGNFWFFENEYSDGQPKYAAGVKFQAGGADAKVPVY